MDRAEFEQLAVEQLDAVYRMALQLARHPDEASDLVQETYLRAIRASSSFEERGGGIRSWLFTILHNVFYSRVEKKKRSPALVEEFFEADESQRQPDEAPPAWDLATLDWDHVDGRLKKAIDNLPEDQREPLLLWGVGGMKYREIAQILDVPIGTVMSRLHRARSTLAKELEEFTREIGWQSAAQATGTQDDG
ncbi:MAG: sigma-70 family RNA polymerase sigma factor [Phycisphaerales bacterium]|nr:sigma-70 family RNA polymerase sigma factor [Phycisphaerales bacterium]